MKYYTLREAEHLIAFYSQTERIECHFELVYKNTADINSKPSTVDKVGILCVDKTTTPPLIAELETVVNGLGYTPVNEVLELRHCG